MSITFIYSACKADLPLRTASHSPLGTTFSALADKESEESIFLCHSRGIVDLKDPSNTWALGGNTLFRNFREVNLAITVTQ